MTCSSIKQNQNIFYLSKPDNFNKYFRKNFNDQYFHRTGICFIQFELKSDANGRKSKVLTFLTSGKVQSALNEGKILLTINSFRDI